MGDSRLASRFSSGPRDLVPLFQQRIGPHFTFVLQSWKQNKKTPNPPHLKRIPEKTDGYKSDMAKKKLLLSAMTVVHQKEPRMRVKIVTIIHMHKCTLTVNSSPPQICEPAVLGRPVIIKLHRLLLTLSPWKDSTGVKVLPKPVQGHGYKFSVLKIIQFMKYSPHFG